MFEEGMFNSYMYGIHAYYKPIGHGQNVMIKTDFQIMHHLNNCIIVTTLLQTWYCYYEES